MSSRKYTLGLDLGIASIGWSVVELTEKDETLIPYRLLDTGVRIFSPPEHPKNGESVNVKRREARGVRVRLRRRKQRLSKVQRILIEAGLIQSREQLYKNVEIDPWEVRSRALDKKVTDMELAKAVLHIAKRRGFKSNRKEDLDEAGGDLKKYIDANNELMSEKGYRTYGEMFYKDPSFSESKRNKDGEYKCLLSRDLLMDELELILKTQVKYNKKITDDLISKIIEEISYQRPIASGEDIINKIGDCSFEDGEKRAPTNSYTFELFRFWQSVNNVRIVNKSMNYADFPLSPEQKQMLSEKVQHKTERIKYTQLRKFLELGDEYFFKGLNYQYKIGVELADVYKKAENKDFVKMPGYHKLRRAVEGVSEEAWDKLRKDADLLDKLAYILTVYKSYEDLNRELGKIEEINDDVKESLMKSVDFTKVCHMSIKALRKIIPEIEKGRDYTEIIEAIYPDRSEFKREYKLPVISREDIRNPVVLRALSQSRKVINAIIDKYGSPTFIHIEFARDMARNFKDRREMLVRQEKNREKNESVVRKLQEEFGIQEPSGTDITKYKYWKEQNEQCVYSGKHIKPEQLFTFDTQIDHAIPYSRCLNDTYFNKVLVLTSENQDKKDMTPFEYFNGEQGSKEWKQYVARVNSLTISLNKKRMLLSKEKPKDEYQSIKDFTERDLNDTRYISRFLKNHIEKRLKFADVDGYKRRVFIFKGRFTSDLRRHFGFNKDRAENNRHHALDAVIVAVSNSSYMQEIATYHKKKENYEDKIKFPEPWEKFRYDVQSRIFKDDLTKYKDHDAIKKLYGDLLSEIKPMFVSQAPGRKVSGQAHEESTYSPKLAEEGYIIKKIPIQKLKLSKIDDIYGDDVRVKEVLEERLRAYDDDPEKAFAEPIYKPSKSKNKNQIKKVKVKEKAGNILLINDGKIAAKRDSMIRIDIFTKDGKYYIVPIYLTDTLGKDLPNKAIKAHADEEDWTEMTDEYEFLFTLYPRDYVEIETSSGDLFEGNYIKTHRRGGTLTIEAHDGSERFSAGIKTAKSVTKYNISVLGEKSLISKEKRVGFSSGSNK